MKKLDSLGYNSKYILFRFSSNISVYLITFNAFLMGRKIGTCQYCLKQRKLIRAHVISKTLFKSLFKNFERIHLVSPTDLETRNLVQDSMYDTGILCEECDNSFAPFENYFKKLMSGHYDELGIVKKSNLNYGYGYSLNLLEGVDHIKLRMFFLITIWRFSVSKQKSFFQINLGVIEGIVKEQLLSGQLNSYDLLPSIIISLQDVNDLRKYTVTTPILMRWENCRCVIFMVLGWVFVYCLESDRQPKLFEYRIAQL